MQILVDPDERICCDNELIQRIQGVLQGALERFALQLSQVTVSLRDLDSSRSGERDKICTVEARIGGAAPVSVCHEALTLTEAIHGAADKLERALREVLRRSAGGDTRPLGVSSGQGLSGTSAVVTSSTRSG